MMKLSIFSYVDKMRMTAPIIRVFLFASLVWVTLQHTKSWFKFLVWAPDSVRHFVRMYLRASSNFTAVAIIAIRLQYYCSHLPAGHFPVGHLFNVC